MIDIIQIYKSKEVFEKSLYTPENRKLFEKVKESVDSVNGFLENRILYLPIEYKNHPDFATADLIIIQDVEGFNPFLINKYLESLDLPEWYINSRRDFLINDNKLLFGLRHLNSPKSFEIFKIVKSNPDTFDLHIDYVLNSMTIEIPERDNHKICELKENMPIRYKINGKSDFTMSGRKQRTFYEFDYIIEFIGQADKLAFIELNKIKKSKKIPVSDCKLINERKILR